MLIALAGTVAVCSVERRFRKYKKMFYSHQLLARKAPLGQIWMAATMHARINRRKLDKLNIIKICEEILNPSVPMALRLSGILMGGVVIVYERKVKLLYDDVTRLLVEINEAWKVKKVLDPTVLPKGKSHAKKEAVTLPENEEANIGEMEQSLQFTNATTTVGFQQTAYFAMRLDSVNEPYIDNGAREEEPSQLHQADAENITLFERFDSFQTNADAYNRFERFDIEGDEETQPDFTSGNHTQFPTTLLRSPPRQDDQIEIDMIQDQLPGDHVNKQSEERIEARQDQGRRCYMTRKRRQQAAYVMDYEQTIIPGHTYQFWLQNTSDIVSRRGRKRKRTNIMTTKKIAKLMELPPVVLIGDLFTNGNRDVYYPPPILELWIRSTQPPQDSPSDRVSTPQPLEPSFSSHPQAHNQDFMGFPFEDYDRGVDGQMFGASIEKLRNNDLHNEIHMDELRANLDDSLRMPEATPKIIPGNSGDGAFSIPSSVSEHGPASHSDISSGRSRKKRDSSSKNSGGLLEPVAEETSRLDFGANFKLSRLSENGLSPDQELLVETAPTQTQVKTNHPVDKMTDSVRTHMKAHFDAPGAPKVESLDVLATGMNRKTAALLFYQTCVLATRDFLKVEQKVPYGEILISKGSKM